MARPGRVVLRRAIRDSGGLISDVADLFQTSRQTIYNWMAYYGLRGEVVAARQQMREVAADVIYQRLLTGGDDAAFEAAKFVMLHLQNDGELLEFSSETLRILAEEGITPSEAVRAFEEMMQARAQMRARERSERE